MAAKPLVAERTESENQTPESAAVVLLVQNRIAARLSKHVIPFLRVEPDRLPSLGIPLRIKSACWHLKELPQDEVGQREGFWIFPNVRRPFNRGMRLHEDERCWSVARRG